MRIIPSSFPLILFLLILPSGFGCSSPVDDEGVVARINGEPIYLAQLEAAHDLKFLARTSLNSTFLDHLHQEYGAVLSEILVQRLVIQFLARQDMAVSQEELDAVEAQVRSDYPEGAFEQILIEEYIHLDRWRDQLRATLSQEKLLQKILRPTISIDYQEVDAYYRRNIADFYLRPKVRFLFIQGQERDQVEKVAQMSASEPDPEILGKRFDRVDVHAYTLREDNIPADWQALLGELEPMQTTQILGVEDGYQALTLLERTGGRIVDPAQAYPLVERILVERKLQEAFDAWLANELQSSEITVNRQLLGVE